MNCEKIGCLPLTKTESRFYDTRLESTSTEHDRTTQPWLSLNENIPTAGLASDAHITTSNDVRSAIARSAVPQFRLIRFAPSVAITKVGRSSSTKKTSGAAGT